MAAHRQGGGRIAAAGVGTGGAGALAPQCDCARSLKVRNSQTKASDGNYLGVSTWRFSLTKLAGCSRENGFDISIVTPLFQPLAASGSLSNKTASGLDVAEISPPAMTIADMFAPSLA